LKIFKWEKHKMRIIVLPLLILAITISFANESAPFRGFKKVPFGSTKAQVAKQLGEIKETFKECPEWGKCYTHTFQIAESYYVAILKFGIEDKIFYAYHFNMNLLSMPTWEQANGWLISLKKKYGEPKEDFEIGSLSDKNRKGQVVWEVNNMKIVFNILYHTSNSYALELWVRDNEKKNILYKKWVEKEKEKRLKQENLQDEF